jgi:hypothetical protein
MPDPRPVPVLATTFTVCEPCGWMVVPRGYLALHNAALHPGLVQGADDDAGHRDQDGDGRDHGTGQIPPLGAAALRAGS